MDDDYTHLAVHREADILTIKLIGPSLFKSRITNALEAELLEMIEKEQPFRVVVDFTGIERCSTAVMNALLRVKRRVVTRGGHLKLCSMIDSIRDVYKLLKLDGTVFDIYETLDDAYADFD